MCFIRAKSIVAPNPTKVFRYIAFILDAAHPKSVFIERCLGPKYAQLVSIIKPENAIVSLSTFKSIVRLFL